MYVLPAGGEGGGGGQRRREALVRCCLMMMMSDDEALCVSWPLCVVVVMPLFACCFLGKHFGVGQETMC